MTGASSAPPSALLLRADGTAVVFEVSDEALPIVRHWGADVGDLSADELAGLLSATDPVLTGLDVPLRLTVLPGQPDGWLGRPGLAGHRDGGDPYPRLTPTAAAAVRTEVDGAETLTARSVDRVAGVAVRSEFGLTRHGVLRVRHELTNIGSGIWTMERLECLLPLPGQAQEVLDFTGRWPRERVPQRRPLTRGTHVRESRRGHTGHDATGLLVAGTAGFGFRHGEVWAVHIGWSGNHVHAVERLPEGVSLLGGGELLGPGEVRLAPGESYATPYAYFAYSDHGLDGLSGRLHSYLRDRPHHPRGPRPVVLNTWEAVYFDQRLDRLTALAELAARVGVERFVLDDGWFLGRRDDTAGLGDWFVDPAVWPDGLHPLAARVRELGMQFGLWFEPEMVNPRSRLAVEHPDWMLAAPGRLPLPARSQFVLDVANPEVYAYLLERLDSLVTEYRLDYIKWDHNRDLVEAVHDGHSGVHLQTLAVYQLLADLRRRHPRLEIESCSGGGARIDYGILEHSDRVWTSDTNDPLERQQIQRWTGLLLPPELMGAHVGPNPAHTTGRTTGLAFRTATALFGHSGIEWDLTSCTEAELDHLTAWICLYKRLRPLLHTGAVVHADHPDPAVLLHGVVSPDLAHAVFCYAQVDSSLDTAPPRLRLPGLNPGATYVLEVCHETGLAPQPLEHPFQPRWMVDGATGTGRVLAEVGLQAPKLSAAQAVIFELRMSNSSA